EADPQGCPHPQAGNDQLRRRVRNLSRRAGIASIGMETRFRDAASHQGGFIQGVRPIKTASTNTELELPRFSRRPRESGSIELAFRLVATHILDSIRLAEPSLGDEPLSSRPRCAIWLGPLRIITLQRGSPS